MKDAGGVDPPTFKFTQKPSAKHSFPPYFNLYSAPICLQAKTGVQHVGIYVLYNIFFYL